MLNTTAPRQLRIDQQITTKFVHVTPELAEEWLGKNESNRNLRAHKIAEYARDIAAGKWNLTGESIKFDFEGRLIDGQHRLHACIAADTPFHSLVIHGLEPRVRANIDTNAKRSAGDALKMQGLTLESGKRIAAIIKLANMFDGDEPVRAGQRPPSITHEEVIDAYMADVSLFDYAAQFSGRHCRKISARPAALGAACVIAGRAGLLDEFSSFIVATAELNFRGERCPRAVLFRRLTSLRVENHQASEEIYFMLRAFKAELDGKSIGGMKSTTGHGPSAIITDFGKGVAA